MSGQVQVRGLTVQSVAVVGSDPQTVTVSNMPPAAALINDGVTSTTQVWSSSKTSAQVAAETTRAEAAERLVPTAVKTGAVTAAAGQMVLCDTTGGAFAVTLPSAPADLTQVGVMCVAGAATFAPPTVAAGAGDSLGPTVSGSIGQVGETLVLQYQASVKVWRPVAGRLSMAALTAQINNALAAAEAYTNAQLAAAASAASGYAYTGFSWYGGTATSPDTYQALNASGQDAGALTGNTGYTRLTTGVVANPAVQSRMRRCIVADDGSHVVAYLDADNSNNFAGIWNTSTQTQTGWVRVYEGPLDPVKPTPGQTGAANTALWQGVEPYDPGVTYARGARASSGGALWDSLNDGNLGITPAAGTTTADLTGTLGQVMVEIPAFYYRMDHDSGTDRYTYEVVFDPSAYRLFPDLSTASTAPTTVTVNGRVFALHPTFTKAGIQRRARYHSAFDVSATDTGNNASGTLRSIADGTTVYATNIANTNFRSKARNRNTGHVDMSGQANDLWSMGDYWIWHALQLLLFVEYRTFYSQAVIGGGNQAGSDYTPVTGRTAPMGNGSGVCDATGAAQTPTATGDFSAMTWRGIEDLWGSSWKWMDGWNIQNAPAGKLHYVSNTPSTFAYSTTSGYELEVTSLEGIDNWQYPTDLVEGSFLPSAAGASQSTYETDGYYANAATDNSWRVAPVGGYAGIGGIAGAACLYLSLGPGSSSVSCGVGLTL